MPAAGVDAPRTLAKYHRVDSLFVLASGFPVAVEKLGVGTRGGCDVGEDGPVISSTNSRLRSLTERFISSLYVICGDDWRLTTVLGGGKWRSSWHVRQNRWNKAGIG